MGDTKKIRFHYKKSAEFRVVHADGAWGGLTPDLNIFFALFNSRPPIPEILVHELGSDGTLGPEIEAARVTKDGLIREVEVGIIMTPDHIKSLIDFLQARLDSLKKIQSETPVRRGQE